MSSKSLKKSGGKKKNIKKVEKKSWKKKSEQIEFSSTLFSQLVAPNNCWKGLECQKSLFVSKF